MLHLPLKGKVASFSSLTAAAVPLNVLAVQSLLEVPVAQALLEV